MSRELFCVILFHMVRLSMQRITSPELLNNAIVLHDNATAHTANSVKNRLRRWGWEVLHHPPCSPDLSPCDYDFLIAGSEYLIHFEAC
jgi:transposase